MNKVKVLAGVVGLTLALLLVAGCGSGEKPTAQQPAASQQHSGHDKHNMPKEDPMPMMRDLDQQLQDLMKQVKAGKMMDAQNTGGQLVSTTGKVMPHMMDHNLKDSLHKAAVDIRDTVSAGAIDPNVLEGKVKALQDIMNQTLVHLKTMKH